MISELTSRSLMAAITRLYIGRLRTVRSSNHESAATTAAEDWIPLFRQIPASIPFHRAELGILLLGSPPAASVIGQPKRELRSEEPARVAMESMQRCGMSYSPLLSLSPPEAHHALFPCSSSSGSSSVAFSAENNIPYSHLDTVSLSSVDSREFHGLKEDVNEYNFFSKASGAEREGRFRALGSSSPMGEPHQSSDHNLITNSRFATALASEEDKAVELEKNTQKPRPFNCFFNERPQRSKGSWMSLEEDPSKQASYSNTNLSIASSQYHNGLMLST